MLGKVWKYTKNVLIGIDQLGNSFLCGDPDETISSRAGKKRGLAARVIDWLFFWQPNHTQESIEDDEGKDAIL